MFISESHSLNIFAACLVCAALRDLSTSITTEVSMLHKRLLSFFFPHISDIYTASGDNKFRNGEKWLGKALDRYGKHCYSLFSTCTEGIRLKVEHDGSHPPPLQPPSRPPLSWVKHMAHWQTNSSSEQLGFSVSSSPSHSESCMLRWDSSPATHISSKAQSLIQSLTGSQYPSL